MLVIFDYMNNVAYRIEHTEDNLNLCRQATDEHGTPAANGNSQDSSNWPATQKLHELCLTRPMIALPSVEPIQCNAAYLLRLEW